MRRSALALVTACALAGCSTLPTSGPVVGGGSLTEQLPPRVLIEAAPPAPGAGPEAIVGGFVDAMKSFEPGYATAELFLTPPAADTWNPDSGIQLYDASNISVTESAPGSVTVSYPLVGTVGPDRTYAPVTPASSQQVQVPLEQVDGQWRIAQPPVGLLVSEADFEREFSFEDVYFAAPAGDSLIPDQVVVPSYGTVSQQSTVLVRSLIAGPTDWLKPAVQTAFPPETALALSGVTVEGTQAQVELTDPARTATPQAREIMAAQLAVTLGQVGVDSLSIRAGGLPFVTPDAPEGTFDVSLYRSSDPGQPVGAPTVYAVRDGIGVTAENGETRAVGGRFGSGEERIRSMAVNVTAARVAAVSEDGRSLLIGTFRTGQPAQTVYVGTDLSNPTWDPSGVVWVVDRTSTGSQIRGVDGTDLSEPLEVPGLDGARVTSVHVSTDGARLLLATERGGQQEVAVALLRRGADRDQPLDGLAVVGLRTVPTGLASVQDAAWTSPTILAVLGSAADAAPEPHLVDLNGSGLRSQGPVGEAVTIAAATGQSLVVGTQPGKLYRQNSQGNWVVVGDGREPTYVG